MTVHPEGDKNICTTFHGSSFNICKDTSLKNKNVNLTMNSCPSPFYLSDPAFSHTLSSSKAHALFRFSPNLPDLPFSIHPPDALRLSHQPCHLTPTSTCPLFLSPVSLPTVFIAAPLHLFLARLWWLLCVFAFQSVYPETWNQNVNPTCLYPLLAPFL